MAKQKAGDGKCPVCAERIVWRESATGALSCFCQDCDFQAYAKDGTEAKRRILASITAKPEGGPQPAPVPEKKPGAFGVFGL